MLIEVTRTLVDHLQSHTVDLDSNGASWIDIQALHSQGTPTADKLNVFLYALEEHPHYRNRPPVERAGEFVRSPLHLRLHYLLAYHSPNHEETQRRLTRVLQAMMSAARLGSEHLRPALLDHVDHLTVALHSPSLEERNQLWSALGSPMRLALHYLVDVAVIEPTDPEGIGLVRELRIGAPA